MKRLFLLAAFSGCIPALAQSPDPKITVPAASAETATTSGIRQMTMPALPTELKFSELGKNWRRFRVRTADANTARMYGGTAPQYEQILNDLGIGVHFTKGDNLTMGKETYLIAYRVDPGLDPQDMQQEIQQRLQAMWGHGEQAPPPRPAGKFSPRASLKLSLLNLRNLGDLEDLRTFDPKVDLLLPKDLREISNYNLRRLGQILQQQSRWQALPLRDVAALRQALRNQHAPASLLREPATNETYHLNTTLNGKKMDRIGNRKTLPMIYEAAPSTDNTRGVLFADGRVERIPEWKWARVRSVKLQGPTALQNRVLSATQMKNIYNLLSNYSRRHNSMPRFKDSTAARQSLMNNFGYGPQTYKSPASGQWYLFNTAISGIALKDVSNKNQVVAVYEPDLGGDGKRGAIFLDGVVRRIPSALWKSTLAVKPKKVKAKTGRMAANVPVSPGGF